MKKNILSLLVISLVTANIALAEYALVDPSDFTGDAFFTPPMLQEKQNASVNKNKGYEHSIPPLKRLRIKVKNRIYDNEVKRHQLAPVAPMGDVYSAGTDVSEYASKDLVDDFDETMMPDGFEADEVSLDENSKTKHSKHKNSKKEKNVVAAEESESIILDCEKIDYDTNNYCIIATGNVSVDFVKQNAIVKADKITYDRVNNTIKAEENVRIIKNGKTITGDYIFVDMNEENAFIEKPSADFSTITMKAERGYLFGDKIVQEQGSLNVDDSFPMQFRSGNRGPWLSRMITPEDEIKPVNADKDILKLQAKNIQITQKGDLEIISLKKAKFSKGKTTILKVPSVKVYTNKNFDFVDSNSFEVGFIRGLGMYAGPGVVFEIPGGSILKAMPILNYNHGFGIGAIARYNSASNWTQAAYGSVENKFLIRGKQKLDDHLYIQYVMNDYMREWFLGRRRAKYGASLVYENGYSSDNFLIKKHTSSFSHRAEFGYFHDMVEDSSYEKIQGSEMGTTRARYMAQANQNVWNYRNNDAQTMVALDVVGQLSAALYGTGDTQMIGRIGPIFRTQYRRWMQEVGYFHSVYEDNTPVPVFDAYRYGKSNVFVREYLRLNKFFTVSWFGSMNVSNDAPNDKTFQENAFYLSFGPEDIKFSIGYDFIRENTLFTLEMMMDAKGTHVDYDRLEIKQDKKAMEKEKLVDKREQAFQKATESPVLQHAVVEDLKILEDVL